MKVEFFDCGAHDFKPPTLSVFDFHKELYYGTDFEAFLLERVKEKEWVYDADNCDQVVYYFVVKKDNEDPKVLAIYHDWWLNIYREDPEDEWIFNEFLYEYQDHIKVELKEKGE